MAFAGAVWLAVQEDLYRCTISTPVRKSPRGTSLSQRSNRSNDAQRRGLDSFDDYFLSQCFHLTRPCLRFLVDYIKARMKNDVFNPTCDAKLAEAMTLGALYFYAHGFLSEKISAMLGLDYASTGDAVNVVSKVLAEMAPNFITFPGSYDDRLGVAQGFKNASGIPNVVGVLGCLHVKVKPKPAEEKLFLNSTGYHSVMVQIISDTNGNLLSVEKCYPGGTSEQTVWEKSDICKDFDLLQHGQTWVVGGRGLAVGRHVLTAVEPSNVKTLAARRFNAAHSLILNFNHHTFGSLKTRFQCLQDLGGVQALEPVAHILTACCVLHNIAKKFSVPQFAELVIEAAHPVLPVKKEGGEESLHDLEEAREDMIEMCFGNAEENLKQNADQN